MKELDKIITQHIQAMLDAPIPIELEEKWRDFEKRKKQQQKPKKFAPGKLIIVAASVLIVFLVTAMNSAVVIGFKDNLFQWVTKTNQGGIVISEKRNPEYKAGTYHNLTWEEAKSMVSYELKDPQYIPEILPSPPEISLSAEEYPLSEVTIKYIEEETSLKIKQRNMGINENRNIYVPQNAEHRKLPVRNGLEVIVLENEGGLKFIWIENNVRFEVLAKEIPEEEIIKVINGLK